jgi:hypothetical protein
VLGERNAFDVGEFFGLVDALLIVLCCCDVNTLRGFHNYSETVIGR